MSATPAELTQTVATLAKTLDDLCGRINQTLPTDGNYLSLDDPGMERGVNDLVAFSDECSTALDDPTVRAAMKAAREGAQP